MKDNQSKSRIIRADGEVVGIKSDEEQNMRMYDDDSVAKTLTDLSLEEHLSEIGIAKWGEGLPYPLASILRHWSTTPDTEIIPRLNHLIHFFEALAQYVSTILLSAYSSHADLWEERKEFLRRALKGSNLSLARASFGTWKTVIENLGRDTRKLLNSNDAKQNEILKRLYGDGDHTLAAFVSDRAVLDQVRRVNGVRNSVAHGGNLPMSEANILHSSLSGELEDLRQISKLFWYKNCLIMSSGNKPRKNKYENDVRILRGSNSQFRSSVLVLDQGLDVEHMYLHNEKSNSVLKLLPLFRLGPSPISNRNTCYFFNRIGRDSIRFVTYQSARQSAEDFDLDDCSEVLDMVNSLSQSTPTNS